jgi:outer membrane lipoprotein-sorting protein/peroxiredoxin
MKNLMVMKTNFALLILAALFVLAAGAFAPVAHAQEKSSAADDKKKPVGMKQDPKARQILDAAKAKLMSLKSLTADYESNRQPTKNFDRQSEIFLERPNRFRVEQVGGAVVEERVLQALSDGQMVSTFNSGDFVAYEKPIRKENFFLGINFLVQFFFDTRDITFDPSDATWGRAMSMFDTNASAYDRDTEIKYLGERNPQGTRFDVIEIKYNTRTNDIRQQIYIGDDKLVYQVDTYFDGMIFSQKYRNFRVNQPIPAKAWSKDKIKNMPLIASDPIRMGADAPDFTLPGHDGGEFTMKQMLSGKKGMYICTFDGAAALATGNADTHLPQMRMLQEMKDKYEKQGLMVVAIVGGTKITPDLKEEMMLNWMPDVTRFNYPILIDIDLEKGIQGAAYQNFNLNGRNNILLDAKGRVVFAAKNFNEKVNQLALYQALAQIGFTVSAADLESAAAH